MDWIKGIIAIFCHIPILDCENTWPCQPGIDDYMSELIVLICLLFSLIIEDNCYSMYLSTEETFAIVSCIEL